MTNHLPVLPYRHHYILSRRIKISSFFEKPRCCIATRQRRQSQSHSGNHLFGPCGWHFKEPRRHSGRRGIMVRELSPSWPMASGAVMYRGVWAPWLPWDVLEKTVDVIFRPRKHHSSFAFFPFSLSSHAHDGPTRLSRSARTHPVVELL